MLNFDFKAARRAWTYAAVLLTLAAVFAIRKTLLVFVIALMFAYLLYPLVEALHQRLGCKSRTPAILVPYVLIFGALLGFGIFAGPRIALDAAQLAEQIRAQHVAEWSLGGLPVGGWIVEHSKDVLGMLPQLGLGHRLGIVAKDIGNFFIIPILSFFFLKDGPMLCHWLLEIFDGRHRRAVENVIKDAHVLMLQYMRALLFLCLATLVCFAGALSWLHTPYALLLAVAAFVLEFVPLVGPLTAGTVILGVSAFSKQPQIHVLRIALFLVAYRLFQDYVLSPHLMKKGVALHPLLVIFGVFAGGEIGGVGGIFLSVPVLAVLRLIYYEVRKQRAVELPAGQLLEVSERAAA